MILVLNSGAGNFCSVARMIQAAGGQARIGHSKHEIASATKIILPGVGHFDNGMRGLHSAGIVDVIKHKVLTEGIPILGICLGMQLLCLKSEEGNAPGLGLIDANVERFRFLSTEQLKVPHMGWNAVKAEKINALLPVSDKEQRFYFVHSYRVIPNNSDIVIGKTYYGSDFCAAFQKRNIFGVQFHPEKSHRFGLELIRRFVEL